MLAAALILAQVVGAAPTPVPAGSSPNAGIPAGQIKLNRSVSFRQDTVPVLPTPTPVPLPKTGVAPHAATAPSSSPSGMTADRERSYRDRYAAAAAALSSAQSALAAAEVAAPGCITTYRKNSSFTDCTARDGALLSYRMAVPAADAALAKLQADCRADVYCMPHWVQK